MMSLPWRHFFLISPLEAIARVSYEWDCCLCIYSPDLVFSFFVVVVAVVWAPRTVEPFLFFNYGTEWSDRRMIELCIMTMAEVSM
jgi:hypothetical protein